MLAKSMFEVLLSKVGLLWAVLFKFYDRKVRSKLWRHLLTMLESQFTILAKASIINYDHNPSFIVLALRLYCQYDHKL